MIDPADEPLIAALVAGSIRYSDDARGAHALARLVADLIGDTEAWLAAGGASGPDAAATLVWRLMVALSREVGGQTLYIPTLQGERCQVRDRDICAAYDYTIDGPNGLNALGRRYGLSVPALYRIIARERGNRLAVVRDLFDGTEHAPGAG